jgi:translation initiation factor 3 subunit E
VGQFLDNHLVLPIVEFLDEKKVYTDPNDPTKSSPELLQGKFDLLKRTNMTDYAQDFFKQLHPKEKSVPEELTTRREEIMKEIAAAKERCTAMIDLLQDQANVKQLRMEKLFNASYLQEAHQIAPEQIEALYAYGKIQFECGQYAEAAGVLAHYYLVGEDEANKHSSLWGKLASEILMRNWDVALEDLMKLREVIDNKTNLTHLEQLQQRSWLIHWGLFVFFNHPVPERGRTAMIELCFSERYLNTIQTNCPHVLRYLTCAVICNKRRRNLLKDLVKVIQQEQYTFRDPMTMFLERLYVDFDFDEAQVQLGLCEKAIMQDYFLHELRDEFLENARVFIFETYCRIHRKVDIGMLAQKLHREDVIEVLSTVWDS